MAWERICLERYEDERPQQMLAGVFFSFVELFVIWDCGEEVDTFVQGYFFLYLDEKNSKIMQGLRSGIWESC